MRDPNNLMTSALYLEGLNMIVLCIEYNKKTNADALNKKTMPFQGLLQPFPSTSSTAQHRHTQTQETPLV
jgi:hypothetical protein